MQTITQKQLYHFMHMGSKAPSGHNTQPWKFKITNQSLRIYPDYSRKLPVVDVDNHALFISLGCALENIVLAAKNEQFESIIHTNDNEKDFFIDVAFQKNNEIESSELYNYIQKRQVTRSKFMQQQVEPSILDKAANVLNNDVSARTFMDAHQKSGIESFILSGNQLQFANKAFKHELVNWIRFNQKDAMNKGDGIWGGTMGMPGIPGFMGKFIMQSLTSPSSETKRLSQLFDHTSGYVLFSVIENNRIGWIELGRNFQRYTLALTQYGVKHAHLNMPCEEEAVREKMAETFNLRPLTPLLLIRIGYAAPMPYSYRRKVNSLIIK